LSEPFDTKEEADEKFEHLHKKTKAKSSVISIPEIKCGLKLFTKKGYYETIYSMNKNLYSAKADPFDENEIGNPILPNHLIEWFILGLLDSTKEEYDENVKENIVPDLDDCDDIELKDEDE